MKRQSKSFAYLFALLGLTLTSFQKSHIKTFTLEGYAQGTTYKILYYAKDSVISSNEIEAIFAALDSSLSIYKPYSLISKFNNDEVGIDMDRHLHRVVKKSIEVYKRTHGIFDITIHPLVEAWGFGTKRISHITDSNQIKSLLAYVGSDKIELNKQRLEKNHPCVKIDVNGIAQGYTVDYIADFLEKKGLKTYIVEVGGELRIKGKKPNGEYFKVGIESPAAFAYQAPVINKVISIKKGAITTSGSYRKYVESDGKRLSHLINPKTGFPFKTDIISVTIIAKTAFIADAYDNVLMGMKIEQAVDYVNQKKNMHAYFIYRDKNGVVRDTFSNGFHQYLQ